MKKSLISYNQYSDVSEAISYEVWCGLLDSVESGTLSEGVKDVLAKAGSVVMDSVLRLFKPIKDEIIKIATDFKLSIIDIIKAFKQRDIYALLRALQFKISTILRALDQFNYFWIRGLKSAFEEISKNKYFQKIRSGVMKLDDVLDKYPIIKKVGGPAVAGLLLYVWLNSSFTGKMDIDMNISQILSALRGSYSLADVLASPDGMMMITLFATGGLISATWLSSSTSNLLLALTYTGYKKIEGRLPPALKQLESIVDFAT